jgi:hypothetical protein
MFLAVTWRQMCMYLLQFAHCLSFTFIVFWATVFTWQVLRGCSMEGCHFILVVKCKKLLILKKNDSSVWRHLCKPDVNWWENLEVGTFWLAIGCKVLRLKNRSITGSGASEVLKELWNWELKKEVALEWHKFQQKTLYSDGTRKLEDRWIESSDWLFFYAECIYSLCLIVSTL